MPDKFKVVISGISGRFPECTDVQTFKEKLYNGDEFITLDDRKWPVGFRHKLVGEKNIPDHTGKISNIHKVDHTVFKLNTLFAKSNDIINRVILEPCFEAIVDAGVNPYSLDGHNVGVFMSTGLNDIEKEILDRKVPSDILCLIGSNKTMMSNRISFAFNFTGPSFTNHVDMHGGLESLSLAYKSVSEGFVEAAIVGVVNSVVHPYISVQYSSLGLLSSDGTTRPFDEWAKGYVRSESVVCFYLQRAEDAKRNYGEIKFCDFQLCGSKLPNFIGFDEEYIRNMLQHLYEINDSPIDSLGYVEMNAYGHKTMDEAESNAIAEVLTKNRKNPLLIGSIKSNIGHTESSAGIMGVLKALFALESGRVAPNKNLMKLNEEIRAFRQKRLQVVTEETPLPGNTVAVNSIGLFGTVGLTLVKQNEKSIDTNSSVEGFPRILLMCGRKEDDLRNKLAQIEKLSYDPNFISLVNDSLGQHMPLHIWRGYTLLPPPSTPICEVQETGGQNRPIWFIFSGMGSQWNTMGKSLLNLPLFAETVAKCDSVLRKKNIDIYNILTSDDPTLFDNIMNAFVGIITVQIGLYEIVKALGIKPDGIIGHSVGENGCAYADGCLSLEQAVLASWARGVASTEVQTIKGMMAAVGKGYAAMKDTLPDDIQVACHNSADSCTLTGPAESVNDFVKELQKNNIFAKAVSVANIAYHSKYIAPASPKLLERLKEVIPEPRQRSSKWLSTSVPESEWETPLAQQCSPEYLTNNLLSPVLFEEGCKHIPENAICIEFAPHGLLQAILKRSLPESCTNIPLTSRIKGPENLNFLLSSIGRLYIHGLEPQVNNIFPSVEYPVPRGTAPISPYCTWYHIDEPSARFLKPVEIPSLSEESIPVCTKEDSDYVYLKDHEINGDTIVPPSFFVYLAWWVLSCKRMETIGSTPVIFEDVIIHKQVRLKGQEIKYVSIMVQNGSGDFEIIMRDQEQNEKFEVIATGRILVATEKMETAQIENIADENEKLIPKLEFYEAFTSAGYDLGKEFCLVNDVYRQKSGYRASVTWNGNWVTFLDALMKVQMFSDNGENVKNVFLNQFRKLEINAPEFQALEKGTIIPCEANMTTKQLGCNSVLLSDLRYKSFPVAKIQLNEFRFVSYQNPRCQSIPEFFILSLEIAIENLNASDKNINKLAVVNATDKYSQILEEIIEEIFVDFPVTILSPGNSLSANEGVLIIADDMDKIEKCYVRSNSLLLLSISPLPCKNDVKMTQLFVEITSQTFSGMKISLLKQRSNFKEKPFVFVDNQNGQNRNKIKQVVDGSISHFIVCRNIDYPDLSNLVASKKNNSNAKYLYIMDEMKNGQRLEELVKNQINKNLSVSILKQGEWGSYRKFSSEIYQKSGKKIVADTPSRSNLSCNSVNLNYICVTDNLQDDASTKEKILSFAYAGYLNNNEKVVGLGTGTTNPESLHCDPHLRWTVPADWGLKGAVTIPYTYAQAYRLLFSKFRPIQAKTVMIIVGKEYLLAEALIVLAMFKDMEIFIVISTEEEEKLFESRFPKIPLDHILYSQNCSYEIQTRNISHDEGIDHVINCLSGVKHVEACLRCLAVGGIYMEFGTHNCSELNNIGLYSFLRLKSFYVVQNRISDLLELSLQTKQKMKEMIEECLKEGVITPSQLSNHSSNSTCMKIVKCHSKSGMQYSRTRGINYDSKHSYLIIGAGTKDDSWFKLIEWLIAQGARKFIIALEKCTLPSRIEHRISKLLVERNVKVFLTSTTKLENKEEVNSFLKETEKLAPLEAVFFVSFRGDARKISNLDSVVPADVYFIGLSSTGLKEFEHRHMKGSPAIFFHCDKSENVLAILPYLNQILSQDDNNNAEVLYQVTETIDNSTKQVKIIHPSLRDYLPQDIETLDRIGQEEIKELTFVEMTSLSRRMSCSKGVYPIFALPAAHSIMLKPLFERLLHPVFSATAIPTHSIKHTAHKLYQSLNEIQPSGPVTIISEAWTLPVALELVSYVQLIDRKYRIFVLEGNPENWSDSVSREKAPASYAEDIFHFDKKTKDKHHPPRSFDDMVEIYTKNACCDARVIENVIRGAKLMRDKIKELTQVHLPKQLLKNITWFERYHPTKRTFNLSTTSEIIVVNESNYRNLLSHPQVSKIINENAEYNWWECTNQESI